MFIVHVALQGCLRAENVQYGITPDTGGHIKYLLELVEACAGQPDFTRSVMATRAFESSLGAEYSKTSEPFGDAGEIVRFPTTNRAYLAKEDLAGEVSSFADALVEWIEAQPQRPDFLHAHYADAASVASIVKTRLKIPFVFTGHSLGRPKALAMGAESTTSTVASLKSRIAAEEKALRQASLVIASSRDEAEVQYGSYEAYEPGRIRIVPPGSDLQRFAGARSTPAVEAMLARFLTHPEKPAILAIARPVRKKNLPALVEAYGRSSVLRATANLVLVAGCRDDVSALDAETAAEMRTILELIDCYDLYGQIAYPKRHETPDVPALYAFARERFGVFVNPALNEPFGLTLLEAAASGLPVVATESGGPNDIVETCGNGLLVDPRSSEAIASGCEAILGDRRRWERYARAGSEAVRTYDWGSHARRYGGFLRRLAAPRSTGHKAEQLLVCDIDDTLVGNPTCTAQFRVWHGRQDRLAFGVATGRSFHSALSILEQQEVPSPLVMITSVGSEIYHRDRNETTFKLDRDWQRSIGRDFCRERLMEIVAEFSELNFQPRLEQRALKISCFTDGDPTIARRVRRRLAAAGLPASVLHSHGKYLDILPVRASKGAAIEHVRRRLALPREMVFAAGDSGNDIEMLRTVSQSIIVANYSDNLADRSDLAHSYVARRTHASGIIEGVAHFRRKPAVQAGQRPQRGLQ